MHKVKFCVMLSLLVGLLACAGMQPTEESLKSVELKGHQISVGMPTEKVRELAGDPDSIVQGQHFNAANQSGIAAASFTWWRYFGKNQDVNLKIDEAQYVREIIVTRYSK